MGLALQSAAWGYSVTADTQFTWLNSSFSATGHGTSVPPSSIVPGASGAGSTYDGAFANSYSGWSFSAAAVQDYAVFYARASSQAHRDSPGNDFEAWQTFATGTFIETLTIPSAPVGVAYGSTGQLMMGWDVTGSSSSGTAGSTYLAMFATTSPSLPNTNSNTAAIASTGHYDLVSPISFYFDTPFQLTIRSSLSAAVGYDYRYSTAPPNFIDAASGDFLHTVILASVGVFDSAGTSLNNFIITTDSGRPFLPAAVPLPSTLLLLGPALAGLVVMRRRFKE